MTFSQFLLIVRSRWKIVAALFVATLLLVIVVGLVFSKKYRAEATVVLRLQPDPVTGLMLSGVMSPSLIATEVDVITSDRVARQVISDLKLTQNAQVRQQWQDEAGGAGTLENWLVDTFQRQLDVRPSRESNVITIGYKAADPAFAAALANAFARAYLATSLALKVDPAKATSGFFDAKTKEARTQLDRAQEKLGAYQREHGLIGSDERLDVETSRLNELASQLVALQTLSTDSTSRQAQAAGGNTERLSEALNSPVISGLKIDLSRAEANLQELGTRLGPNHPSVQQAKANVGELRARIDAETSRVSGSVRVSANINNARVAELRSQLEEQRKKVLQLKEFRDQMALLQHDVDAAQRDFETISERLSQTSMASQVKQTDIVMLSEATPPMKAVFPRWGLNLALGSVLGVLLGLGCALLRELTDRRVRTAADIVAATGLPILGVLPRPAIRRKAMSAMARRVISGRLAAPDAK